MYIDWRYNGRRRRSPWPLMILLTVPFLVVGVYLLATRTAFFENPFDPFPPTPTPTRSAISFLAEAEDYYQAGEFRLALAAYERVAGLNRRTMSRCGNKPGSRSCSATRIRALTWPRKP